MSGSNPDPGDVFRSCRVRTVIYLDGATLSRFHLVSVRCVFLHPVLFDPAVASVCVFL